VLFNKIIVLSLALLSVTTQLTASEGTGESRFSIELPSIVEGRPVSLTMDPPAYASGGDVGETLEVGDIVTRKEKAYGCLGSRAFMQTWGWGCGLTSLAVIYLVTALVTPGPQFAEETKKAVETGQQGFFFSFLISDVDATQAATGIQFGVPAVWSLVGAIIIGCCAYRLLVVLLCGMRNCGDNNGKKFKIPDGSYRPESYCCC
jgi:hypothetical protein